MKIESLKPKKTTTGNRICFTCKSGHLICEFDKLKFVRPVRSDICIYYVILFDDDDVSLYNDGDWIEYGGIRYEYQNGGLDRLWMILENENNLAALESL